ncbi:hypothetical protein Taro_015780 [Colocasia esculenta]|uniref:Uncharacterized protein n=1 Tax=Colocasia esculenta TaxID=4460 RepID=A0A843UID4_COLES|nr:hypothetical protein [Colocasia esculenta]
MGADLLRSHGGTGGRLPAGEIRSSPPVKPSRSTNLARHPRVSPRQADDAFPRSPPSQTKPLRKSPGNHGTPGRSGRRSRIPDSEGKMVVKMPVKRLVMEEVTILKRGEDVKPTRPAEDRRPSDREGAAAPPSVADGADDDDINVALCSTERLGPDPEILPKQIRLVDGKKPLYAGSGFFASPSPRSLPLPTSFFAKKEVANTTDLATRGLRYLLRLDLP